MPANRLSVLRIALLLAAALGVAGAGQGAPLPAGKPTKAEVRAKVLELRKILDAGGANYLAVEKACLGFKALGLPERVQARLAELYLEAKADEKIAILYVLERVGVENATRALPAIASDFATARPKHPNTMSFASYYVVERFMRLAWKKVPNARGPEGRDGVKETALRKGEVEEPPPPPPPARSSADGLVSTGTVADRKALLQVVLAKGLHRRDKAGKRTYALPKVEEDGWARVIGDHAFVRLRTTHRGVDLLFRRSAKGEWGYLATLGQWVN